MSQQAVVEARSGRLIPVLFAVSLSVVGGLFFMTRFLLQENRVDPGHLFGGIVPSRLKTLLALRLEGGELAEFFDAGNQHKVSLVLANGLPSNPNVLAVPDVMTQIDRARIGQTDGLTITSVILRYGNAQINTLATTNVTPVSLAVGETQIDAQRFDAPKQARYLMGVLNLPGSQLYFLFLKKGEPVDAVYAGQILAEMPLVQSAFRNSLVR